MPTGYTVSGRGDLDSLFKPRSSAAIAATGFKSNGGIDLSQRYEPRAATTAIANTGFRKAGTDLAQLFMDLHAATGPTYTDDFSNFVAGQSGTSNRYRGYVASGRAGTPPAMGSAPTPDAVVGSYTIGQVYWDITTAEMVFSLHSGTTPPDTDQVFYLLNVGGTFEGTGIPQIGWRRSDRLSSNTGNQGGLLWRDWRFAPTSDNPVMTAGQSYSCTVTRQNP